uniref:Uncharacterized protein n=1 Tax=Opuntia streptacantha TaxID=393608 RepID=A0A7C9EIU5_OPUST
MLLGLPGPNNYGPSLGLMPNHLDLGSSCNPFPNTQTLLSLSPAPIFSHSTRGARVLLVISAPFLHRQLLCWGSRLRCDTLHCHPQPSLSTDQLVRLHHHVAKIWFGWQFRCLVTGDLLRIIFSILWQQNTWHTSSCNSLHHNLISG